MEGPQLAERLNDARETGLLNLSYLGLAAVEAALAQAAAAPNLRVVELDLGSNGLDALPAGLSAAAPPFANLRCLRAKYNCMTRLPVEQLVAMPRLEAVDLEGNQIGALEEGALPALPTLRRLNLAGNGLAALPDSVGRCRMLEALTLSNNPLTQLPDTLAACPITHLDVSSCRLLSLPAALATCKTLQRFFCQNNDLPKVPTALGHLTNLKEWNLRANRLPLKYEQARERGLAKFLAFLREEEEIEMLQEIERNRPVGIASGPCMVYRCKAVLDDAMAATRAGEPIDGFAWIRSGHAAVQHRNSMFVFGGVVVREGRKTSELLVLNTDTMAWRVQPTRGDRPCPRDGHAMVVDPSGGAAGQLVLFGGRNASGRRLCDLHVLDLATWTWYLPKQEGAESPVPREQASAAFAPDGRFLLFGGRTNGARLNDLWSWDADTGVWEQLPSQGTGPTPRQGAAACIGGSTLFIMGGSSNFVLHDCFAYNLETLEWRPLSIEGQSKAAARSGGHVITYMPEKGYQQGGGGEQEGEGEGDEAGDDGSGSLYLYGGRDALGAQVSYLLKLQARGGGAWYEWVETDFSLQPNRSRIVLFDSLKRLTVVQCGHPLHKLSVAVEQIEKGSCIWDVVQLVPLAAVQEKGGEGEDLAGVNPKRERIKHATVIAAKLPSTFSTHTPREMQVLAVAEAFRCLWMASPGGGAGRLAPCVTLLNECGVEKAVCMTLRWAALPHIELHDLGDVAQFVSEFFTYEPLEDPSQPPAHLVSPWSLLEWQAGDSFDLATLACSLLLGAGYNAFVAVGYTIKQVALGDQSRTECPWLKRHGLEAPPYAELPEEEPSFEVLEEEKEGEERPTEASVPVDGEHGAAAVEGAAAARPLSGLGAAADEGLVDGTAAKPATPSIAMPAASGRSTASGTAPSAAADVQEAADAEPGPADGTEGSAKAEPQVEGGADQAAQQAVQRRRKRYVHAFVLVKPGRRDISQALLLDPATGRHYSMDDAPCSGVEYCWNDRNFWISLQTDSSSSGSGGSAGSGLAELGVTDWSFQNPNCWLPLLVNKEDNSAEAATITTQLSLHSSKASEALLHHCSSHANSRCSPTQLYRASSTVSSSNNAVSKMYSPRTQPTLSVTSATAAAAAAAAIGGGVGSAAAARSSLAAGGVALHHLALGARTGTPRLSVYAPTRELMDSSLAFLSPELTAAAQQQVSSLLPMASTALLLGAGSIMAPPTAAAVASAGAMFAAAPFGGSLPATAAVAGQASQAALQVQPPPGMPLSWVPSLGISRERLDMRCPRGQKAVQYRQARRELYARYGECCRFDGLAERLTTFDSASGAPLCVLELFNRRRDKLARRVIHPSQRSTLSQYEAGAPANVKSIRVVRGAQCETEITFYVEARADGLVRRLRTGSSMEEWFLPGSRPDGLIHRLVQYKAIPEADSATAGQSQGDGMWPVRGSRAGSIMGNLAGRLGSASIAGKPGSRAGSAVLGAAGRSGLLRQGSVPAYQHRRSTVVVGMGEHEQEVASIREKFSRHGPAVEQQPDGAAAAAGNAGTGAAAAGAAAGAKSAVVGAAKPPADAPLVLERSFDLITGETQVVMEAPLSGAARSGGGAEAGTVMRTYGIDGDLMDDGADVAPEQVLREHVALSQACRAAQAAVLAAEEESRNLLQTMQRQEGGDLLETGHYDATRIKVEDSDSGEVLPEEADSYDFLQHFLPHTGARDMTVAEAEVARQACLAAFDDRQAERYRLLCARLSECGAELARLRSIELQHLSAPDQERVRAEEAAAAFRMHVAQRRVEEHAPGVAVKRRELDARLAADRRIAVALGGEHL